jgi:hypothetical protein
MREEIEQLAMEELEKRKEKGSEVRRRGGYMIEEKMKEEIRRKLFDGICPVCENKDKGLEAGKKRRCGKCNTVWVYNDDGFFTKEMTFEEKITQDRCPQCNGALYIQKGTSNKICKECMKKYVRGKRNFEEHRFFRSLDMEMEEHFPYDSLALTYLYNSFKNIERTSIRHHFNHNHNLLNLH